MTRFEEEPEQGPAAWSARVGPAGGQNGRVADLLWDDEIAWLLDPSGGGCLPDAFVDGTTVADWQALLDLVEESGWACEYAEGGTVLPLPRAEAVLSRPVGAECPTLKVWPDPGVCAIFRFLGAEQVDFDLDLRELQGQARLDVLCGFLGAIGRRLRRSVPLYPEGGGGQPLLGYDVAADRVRVVRRQSEDRPVPESRCPRSGVTTGWPSGSEATVTRAW